MAIAKLAQEDPTFKRGDRSLKPARRFSAGMGELHLEIIVDRMMREFNVEANVGKPQVAYRETIRGTAEVDNTHKKQSGGRGQYARTKLKVEPVPGEGFHFRQRNQGRQHPEGIHPGY